MGSTFRGGGSVSGGSASRGWGSASRGKGSASRGKGSASGGAGLHPGEGICIQGVGQLLPHSLGTRKAGSTHTTGMLSFYQKCN